MKERLGLTEIRKQANRMSFGEVRPLTLMCLSHFFFSVLGQHPTSSLSPTSMHPKGTGVALSAGSVPPPPALPFCTSPSPGFTSASLSLSERHPAGPARTS